jgi:hypothetical protein
MLKTRFKDQLRTERPFINAWHRCHHRQLRSRGSVHQSAADALALPIFDGGDMGIRRRPLHTTFKQSTYDPLAASGAM